VAWVSGLVPALALWPWNGGRITVSPLTSPSRVHAATATVADEGTTAANTNQGGAVALLPPRIKGSSPPSSIRACCSPPLWIRRRRRCRTDQGAAVAQRIKPPPYRGWSLPRRHLPRAGTFSCPALHPYADAGQCSCRHHSGRPAGSIARSLSLSAVESEKQRTESKQMC
jgi:hypothetical protein